MPETPTRKQGDPKGAPLGRSARVLIVDDHPVVRCGLNHLLSQQADLEVCGQAESAAEALEIVGSRAPDLAIIDISLQDASGLELIKRLKTGNEHLRILVSSMHDETLFAQRALRAGALGYINKEEDTGILLEAVRRVLRGQIHLSEEMTDQMLQLAAGGDSAERTETDLLSDRELEVFELLGKGITTRDVAERLNLSVKTVETYRENIKNKLGLSNNNELIRRAVEWTLRESRPSATLKDAAS